MHVCVCVWTESGPSLRASRLKRALVVGEDEVLSVVHTGEEEEVGHHVVDHVEDHVVDMGLEDTVEDSLCSTLSD